MSRLRLGLLAPFIPLLAWQGRRLRAQLPRLPEAGGSPRGEAGSGSETLPIVIVGESTVTGVGIATLERGLPGLLARELAAALGVRVRWRAVGWTGATAARITGFAAENLAGERFAAAFLALGGNDAMELTPVSRWRADLLDLCSTLRAANGCPLIVLMATPPMHCFPALPQPLRAFLGARSRMLDEAAGALASEVPWLRHVPMRGRLRADHFCADGVHPSESGYALWARETAVAVAPALRA